MRSRENINDLFCSFVNLEQDSFKSWTCDHKLSRNLDRVLRENLSNHNMENFLSVYFHKNWIANSCKLSQHHLVAYLQEPCYWAAWKTYTKISDHKFKVSDCFQMAMGQVHIVLNGFDPSHGSKLKHYASIAFRSLLINTLRNQHEVDLCSDWALLRKISQRRLETTLTEVGFHKNQIDEHILAWTCFNNVFSPTKNTGIRQLSEPDPSTWQQITDLYNRQRHQALEANSPAYTPSQLQNRLEKCTKLLRESFCPTLGSLNIPKSNQADKEVIEDLPDTSQSFLNEMIEVEEKQDRQQQSTKLKTFLTEALVKLPPELGEVLIMYYGKRLTQTEIAKKLNTKQYKISRLLNKARETLLKALGKWGRDELALTINTEVMVQLDKVLEEWLENHYQTQTVAV